VNRTLAIGLIGDRLPEAARPQNATLEVIRREGAVRIDGPHPLVTASMRAGVTRLQKARDDATDFARAMA